MAIRALLAVLPFITAALADDRPRPTGGGSPVRVRVGTLNAALSGGRRVRHADAKLRQALTHLVAERAAADSRQYHVFALQEVSSEHAADVLDRMLPRLAKKTRKRWSYVRRATGTALLTDGVIASPVHHADNEIQGSLGARVDFGNASALVWNVHLSSYPYGPYLFCRNKTELEVLQAELRWRVAELQALFKHTSVSTALDSHQPIIIAGDWNTPSHQDAGLPLGHTERRWAPNGCRGRRQFAWPATRMAEARGFVDAYREGNGRDPGATWSPVVKYNGEFGLEPQDRIDMVWYHPGGGGGDNATEPQHGTLALDADSPPMVDTGAAWRSRRLRDVTAAHWRGNQWPSDHAAVRADFLLV